jgi:hypothetical protein
VDRHARQARPKPAEAGELCRYSVGDQIGLNQAAADHHGNGELRSQHRHHQIQIDTSRPLPPLRILGAGKPSAGIVHQHAQCPDVGRLRHELLDRLCVSSVGVHEDRPATTIVELVDELGGRGAVGVGDDDARSPLRKTAA